MSNSMTRVEGLETTSRTSTGKEGFIQRCIAKTREAARPRGSSWRRSHRGGRTSTTILDDPIGRPAARERSILSNVRMNAMLDTPAARAAREGWTRIKAEAMASRTTRIISRRTVNRTRMNRMSLYVGLPSISRLRGVLPRRFLSE